jgi:hypothetical protein
MCVCTMHIPIYVSRRSEEAQPNLATTTTEKLQHLEVAELFIVILGGGGGAGGVVKATLLHVSLVPHQILRVGRSPA